MPGPDLNAAVAELVKAELRHTAPPADGFLSWRKKEQVAHVMRLLNRADCQILKHNVKKLFQLWSMYHPEDQVSAAITQIIAKRAEPQGLAEIREDLVRKNNRTRRNAANRVQLRTDDLARANFLLLRTIDPSRLLPTLTRFCHESEMLARYRRVADLPPIMCYTVRHIDQIVRRCQTSTRFPLDLLPRSVRDPVRRLMRRR